MNCKSTFWFDILPTIYDQNQLITYKISKIANTQIICIVHSFILLVVDSMKMHIQLRVFVYSAESIKIFELMVQNTGIYQSLRFFAGPLKVFS